MPPDDIKSTLPDTTALIVEDNAADAELIREVLERNGVDQIILMDNGEDALEYLQDHSPNIVFLDLNLPVLDGRELLDKLDIDGGITIPLVVFTTSSQEEGLLRSHRVARGAYVVKPMSFSGYEKAVEDSLEALNALPGVGEHVRALVYVR